MNLEQTTPKIVNRISIVSKDKRAFMRELSDALADGYVITSLFCFRRFFWVYQQADLVYSPNVSIEVLGVKSK